MTNPTSSSLPEGYPITSLLARNSLNMLCGAPFSGKTTLLAHEVSRYLRDGTLFGSQAPTDPAGTPFLARVGYVICDRIALDSLPIFPASIPIVGRRTSGPRALDSRLTTLQSLYEEFPEPRPQLLIVDGLQSIMPSGKIMDMVEVTRWCFDLGQWCQENDVTILGTASTPKVKPGEPTYALHDRICGSIAWALSMHLILVLDYADQRSDQEIAQARSERGSMRILYRLRHDHSSPPPLYYDFDSTGAFDPVATPDPPHTEAEWKLALIAMAEQHAGEAIRTAQIIEWAASLGVSRPTAERWIVEMTLTGRMERLSKGVYKWLDKPAPTC